MLVISRKIKQSLVIGDDIEITIVQVKDGSVKIAIEAPREIMILRKELCKEVEEENKQSVSANIGFIQKLLNKLK